MNPKNIAIVGTGISGLSAAFYLNKAGHRLKLFEAADYIGGHTHTVGTEYDGEQAQIDTGFIVFNDRTYPNFISLLDEIEVAYQPTEMSFSVRNDHENLEYNGTDINGLFAQRSNLLHPRFYRLLKDILHFNKAVRNRSEANGETTIGEFLDQSRYSAWFSDNYLLPMIAAIWSMGTDDCRDFPLKFFVKFFTNHGLLDLVNRPQWYTIKGGSSSYIVPLTDNFSDDIVLSTPVERIERTEAGVTLHTTGGAQSFDEVVLACHGDQALALLQEPSNAERRILSNFEFSSNQVILHTDTSHLPRRKRAWASWNYRVSDAGSERSTLTYNMNILQRLDTKHTYLVSLNQDIDPARTIREFTYSHPVYSVAMIEAQEQWQNISGVDRIHYCGAYWFNGFHEDGVKSGRRVASMLGYN
ncbi:MAG: FAD-dependent oxidoreductase [Desulfofustis sp.]